MDSSSNNNNNHNDDDDNAPEDDNAPIIVRLPLHVIEQVAQQQQTNNDTSSSNPAPCIVLKDYHRQSGNNKNQVVNTECFFHCQDTTQELSIQRDDDCVDTTVFRIDSDDRGVATKCQKRWTLTNTRELGRRAKQRSEEERRKRREIVVLEEEPPRQPPKRSRVDAAAPSAANHEEPASSGPPVNNEHLEDSDTEAGSSILQMIGLPAQATPEMVRRFFSGLVPQRMVLLPHPAPPAHSLGLDDDDDDMVVLVQFASPSIAQVAAQRSKECLLDERGVSHVIRLSRVSHTVGTYLLEHLGIDGVAKEPFSKTLARVQQRTLKSSMDLLWVTTLQDLQLYAAAKDWIQMSCQSYPWNKSILADCHQLDTTQRIQLRDDLRRELRDMETRSWSLQLQALDAELVALDPVVRLYHLGYQRLKNRIDNLTNWINLYQAIANDDIRTSSNE